MARSIKDIAKLLENTFKKEELNLSFSAKHLIDFDNKDIVDEITDLYKLWFESNIFINNISNNSFLPKLKDCYNSIYYKDLKINITKELNEELICYLASCLEIRKDQNNEVEFLDDDDLLNSNRKLKIFESIIMEAFKILKNNPNIIGRLDSINNKFEVDVQKIEDKYSIRLSDGKYYIASGDMLTLMRDPSNNPSWFMYILKSHALEQVPELFSEMITKESPEELGDYPIICHASLWKEKDYVQILLHCAWQHISATYKWQLDVPIEKAQILFRVCNHPGKIFKNFGPFKRVAMNGEKLDTY